MMPNINVADAAKKMSDGELAASIAAMSTEQKRRSLIKVEGADPEIAAMLSKDHAEMYGNHAGR